MRTLASHWDKDERTWNCVVLISLHFRTFKVALCAPEFCDTAFNHLKITCLESLETELKVFLQVMLLL